MGTVFQEIFAYYGLDWLTMVFGLWGAYLISCRKSAGFALNFIAGLCALSVAVMSGQYGFIVYNFIFMGIALKGYWSWTKPAMDSQIQVVE